MTVVISLAA